MDGSSAMIDACFWGQQFVQSIRPRKNANLLLYLAITFSMAGCEPTPISKDEMLEGMSKESRLAMDSMVNTPFIVEGITSPQFVSASESQLQDAVRVIGIVIEGQARAYPLASVSAMVDHVVNDNVTGLDGKKKPFAVTYCDMTDCIRVLEPVAQSPESSLGIGTLGLLDKGLALQWKGKSFKQMDEVDGLRDVPYQRKSWGEWKAEYPDTKVYIGRNPQRR